MFDITATYNMQMHPFKPPRTSPTLINCFLRVPAFSAPALTPRCRCRFEDLVSHRHTARKGHSFRAGLQRDRRQVDTVISYADDQAPEYRLPTQGESIVRGSADDDQYGVQVMERSKPPADIDYLAVCPIHKMSISEQQLWRSDKTICQEHTPWPVFISADQGRAEVPLSLFIWLRTGAHSYAAEWPQAAGLLWDEEHGLSPSEPHRSVELRYGPHGESRYL